MFSQLRALISSMFRKVWRHNLLPNLKVIVYIGLFPMEEEPVEEIHFSTVKMMVRYGISDWWKTEEKGHMIPLSYAFWLSTKETVVVVLEEKYRYQIFFYDGTQGAKRTFDDVIPVFRICKSRLIEETRFFWFVCLRAFSKKSMIRSNFTDEYFFLLITCCSCKIASMQ